MSEQRRIAGARSLRATVDTPDADCAVVACPPHPQQGGSRTDPRLQAVGAALGDADIACLRFDYGPWDEGVGEQRDASNAIVSARDRYDPVGLFGYSFGAAIALLAGADIDPQPAGVSVLAPPASIEDSDTVGALDALDCQVQVCYGERDDTVDWQPVVERARDQNRAVEAIPGDHFFVGQHEGIGQRVAAFFSDLFQ